jgi:hypothetical protein
VDQALTGSALRATNSDYVEYGALVTVPPPFACSGVVLTAFVLEADAAKLAQLVERVIVAPSGGALRYEPLGHHVMLSFGTIARIQPTTEPYSRQGAVTENSVSLFMPIMATHDSPGPAFACITPYMWVDNPMSLPAGREVFGYPKSWGWPTMPAGSDGPWVLDGFGVNYDRNEVAGRHRLIEVTRIGHDADAAGHEAVHHGHHGVWTELSHVVDHVRGVFETRIGDDLRMLATLAEDLLRRRVEQLFLKQVRSVDGNGAALQQVCGTQIQVSHFRGAPMFGHFHVEVTPLDSVPLGPELGIETQDTSIAFAVHEMDFTLEAGAILHGGDSSGG